MDFSRFNQAEQAQIAAMIEHKQVCSYKCFFFQRQHLNTLFYRIDEGFHETLLQLGSTLFRRLCQ